MCVLLSEDSEVDYMRLNGLEFSREFSCLGWHPVCVNSAFTHVFPKVVDIFLGLLSCLKLVA